MKIRVNAARVLSKSVVGAALAVLCGLVLWGRLGEGWENASYDYLFRFAARTPTNQVVLILMDNASYTHFGVSRTNPLAWNRTWHAALLEKLARAQCPLVVLDVFFESASATNTDDVKLAQALSHQGHVVLDAKLKDPPVFGGLDAAIPKLPANLFLEAAAGWGVAIVDDSRENSLEVSDKIARKHWEFPSSDTNVFSLPRAAARLLGHNPSLASPPRWLRYYSENGSWTELGYSLAMEQPDDYFRERIVFIGRKPETTRLGDEKEDEFGTPFSRWTRESVGGVKILATTFINLMNDDGLKRAAWEIEFVVIVLTGLLLGGGICRIGLYPGVPFGRRIGMAFICALAIGLAVMFGAVLQGYFTNYWFPWLVIAGGQVPLAFAWTVACSYATQPAVEPLVALLPAAPSEPKLLTAELTEVYPPRIPGYEYLSERPFGQGGFGKVWLVRSVIGELNALKIVFHDPYKEESWHGQAEFKGIQKYKPISNNHPGLLHILHVDVVKQSNGSVFFYYVMELGDSLTPDWQKNPDTYVPCNLATLRSQSTSQRMPVRKCIEIALPLAEALDFLHLQNLTHRDIKPENIVFVQGCPKLADVGLVTHIRRPEETASRPGTPGYMPPPPEPVGTVAADIYALGMVLYVISTGRKPDFFPIIKTTLAEGANHADFMKLNAIIVKATHPDSTERFSSAAELHQALRDLRAALGQSTTTECDASQLA